MEIGADAIFVEALDSEKTMHQLITDLPNIPILVNFVEGGLTQLLPAKQLAQMGFAAVAFPTTLLTVQIKESRKMLEELKDGFENGGTPRVVLPWNEVGEAVGFKEYYQLEERYKNFGEHSSNEH